MGIQFFDLMRCIALNAGTKLNLKMRSFVRVAKHSHTPLAPSANSSPVAPAYSIAMISSPPDHSAYCNLPRAYSARVHTCP